LQDEVRRSEESSTNAQNALQQARDEVNRAENLRSNINANLNFRNNIDDIKRVDEELQDIDIESAAKSRKEFNSKYKVALEQEANTHGQVS
jgi:DNA repair protein RAD50